MTENSELNTVEEQENTDITELDQDQAESTEVIRELPIPGNGPETEVHEEAVPAQETSEPTKKELRRQKKAAKKARRKERRDNRVGVPVWLVILIALAINGYWYYTVQYRYVPQVEETYAKYEASIEEYKRQIKAQDLIWRNREEYWQKEIDEINAKADELQSTYEIIMKDLGFEIDENGNAYKPGE